ncbi:MAG: YhdP family protein, partial [Panacagrimonas sp.]
ALFLQRGRLRAGAGPSPHAGDDGLFVTGTVPDLEPLGWVSAVSQGARTDPVDAVREPPPVPALSAELNVGSLWLGPQRVEGVRLSHQPAPGGWITRLSGNGAQGDVSYRNGDDGGLVTGRFERIQVAPRRSPSVDAATAAAARKQEEEQQAKVEPADPNRLPRMDVEVQELRIGTAELGRLDFRTQRIADGQRIEQLRTGGRGGTLEARGEWRRAAGRSSADLQFSLDSDAVDELLKGFGYAPSLSAKRGRFRGSLNWPVAAAGAPRGLKPAAGEGYLDLDVEKGTLRTVDPGAGRVLGLINFWALPRRLSLDFRDVLSEGLAFDEIKGRFDVSQGSAMTNNLDIYAPSLKMEVRGRVGLLARDYDQRVKVYPDVSAGFTLGALILGGPAAGVLALIAQQVLDGPLDQAGELSYRLTGTWDDPHVVREEGGLIPGGAPVAPPPASVAPSATATATVRP